MSDFKKAYIKMRSAEFSDKEHLYLHYLSDEKGYTCGGIYQSANPNALDWELIDKICEATGDIKRASVMIFNDKKIELQVFAYLKKNYWDISRLDEIQHQKVAEEIFMASVLYGHPRAVKMAQKIAGTKEDGNLGDFSIKGINNVELRYFDDTYDVLETQLAKSVAEKHNKEHYLDGWKNRANDSWDINV